MGGAHAPGRSQAFRTWNPRRARRRSTWVVGLALTAPPVTTSGGQRPRWSTLPGLGGRGGDDPGTAWPQEPSLPGSQTQGLGRPKEKGRGSRAAGLAWEASTLPTELLPLGSGQSLRAASRRRQRRVLRPVPPLDIDPERGQVLGRREVAERLVGSDVVVDLLPVGERRRERGAVRLGVGDLAEPRP